MNKIVFYMFVLIALLIVVAYYKGSSQVLGTFITNIQSLAQTLSGRNSQGQFADYPSGGGN